jgi:hypothetical protein
VNYDTETAAIISYYRTIEGNQGENKKTAGKLDDSSHH